MSRDLLFACAVALVGCSPAARETETELTSLFRPESDSAEREPANENWSVATTPREFSFPDDHSAHEDYRIEWWYYTGNLESEDGHRFGYQLTFFRTGFHKDPTNPSKWAVRDLYTAHFAVSDVDNRQHYCFQENNRQGINQAGASAEEYHVWNGGWSAQLDGTEHRLLASDDGVAIELRLTECGAPTLHGDDGLSQKGASEGNASYYYSFTRMPTTGEVRIGDQRYRVTGDSWMDHEFSTSFLEPGQLGWDWMAIQLDSGADLMLYRMRCSDGSTDAHSSGSYLQAGSFQHLAATEYKMTPLGRWKSTATGGEYPLHWNVVIPALGYNLEISPAFDSQEMTTADTTGISYWEGAIDIRGEGPDGALTGRGYMELTGYVGQGLGTLFED